VDTMTRARLTESEGRAALLTAATEMVVESGSPNITVRDVAARAGINHGLVHRYFGTKDTLIAAVIDEISAAVTAELAKDEGGATVVAGDSVGTLARLIGHAMVSGGDDVGADGRPHPVADLLVQRLQDRSGMTERNARVTAAQIVAMVLGWRLNEPFLITACGLDAAEVDTLRAELYESCRRLAGSRSSASTL
jgi:AcrR family transcriptional regulator